MIEVVREIDRIPEHWKLGAVAIGNFDGVHLGHAQLIGELVRLAKKNAGPAIVFTFDPPPAALLRPGSEPPRLTTMQRRADLLGVLGVTGVLAFPTDMTTLSMSAEDFFQSILVDRFAAKAMVEGDNFRFGHARAGDVALLKQLCRNAKIECSIIQGEETGGEWISSSRVRDALKRGEIESANALLTAPYRIEGIVVSGQKRGRTLGFPTANLSQISTMVPGEGVYAGIAWHGSARYVTAIHVGDNPTFDERLWKVEPHLIGFQGDLYGENLKLEFHRRIRGVHRFESVEQLRVQLQLDIRKAQDWINPLLSAAEG